jgi:hypothetical protein
MGTIAPLLVKETVTLTGKTFFAGVEQLASKDVLVALTLLVLSGIKVNAVMLSALGVAREIKMTSVLSVKELKLRIQQIIM